MKKKFLAIFIMCCISVAVTTIKAFALMPLTHKQLNNYVFENDTTINRYLKENLTSRWA
jgi:hypothetical protein